MTILRTFFSFGLLLVIGCASLSQKESNESRLSEAESDSPLYAEEVPSESPPSAVSGAVLSQPTAHAQRNEVRLLEVERISEQSKEARPATIVDAAPQARKSTVHRGIRRAAPPAKAKKVEALSDFDVAEGTQSECDEVLGGDYWAERIRINPALQRFFQAHSRQPFELSVYRRVSSAPEEFTRVFQMEDPALRVSFVVETPPERGEASDFVYEVQLLNRSSETAEYCLKHW